MHECNQTPKPAIWFPTIRAGSGTDIFTERLVEGLKQNGYQAEITWLPHRAEYAPWTVPPPAPPNWANIVHTNTRIHTRFIPTALPTVSTMHLCVHDRALDAYKTVLQKIYHRFWVKPLEAKILNRSQRITAVSRYTADQTTEVFGHRSIQVIYNGVDTSGPFQPVSKRTRHHPFRLLYVGNWSPRKGADLIAPIMQNLGDGFELSYTSGPRVRPARFEVPMNSHDLGYLDSDEKLINQYHNADALLFPSRLEGFGLVALEAQACGLPVVATRCSSIPEIVEDGVTGILCPAGDYLAFAAAVTKLAEVPDLYDTMSQTGPSKAAREFSSDVMIQRYLDVYQSLIAAGLREH